MPRTNRVEPVSGVMSSNDLTQATVTTTTRMEFVRRVQVVPMTEAVAQLNADLNQTLAGDVIVTPAMWTGMNRMRTSSTIRQSHRSLWLITLVFLTVGFIAVVAIIAGLIMSSGYSKDLQDSSLEKYDLGDLRYGMDNIDRNQFPPDTYLSTLNTASVQKYLADQIAEESGYRGLFIDSVLVQHQSTTSSRMKRGNTCSVYFVIHKIRVYFDYCTSCATPRNLALRRSLANLTAFQNHLHLFISGGPISVLSTQICSTPNISSKIVPRRLNTAQAQEINSTLQWIDKSGRNTEIILTTSTSKLSTLPKVPKTPVSPFIITTTTTTSTTSTSTTTTKTTSSSSSSSSSSTTTTTITTTKQTKRVSTKTSTSTTSTTSITGTTTTISFSTVTSTSSTMTTTSSSTTKTTTSTTITKYVTTKKAVTTPTKSSKIVVQTSPTSLTSEAVKATFHSTNLMLSSISTTNSYLPSTVRIQNTVSNTDQNWETAKFSSTDSIDMRDSTPQTIHNDIDFSTITAIKTTDVDETQESSSLSSSISIQGVDEDLSTTPLDQTTIDLIDLTIVSTSATSIDTDGTDIESTTDEMSTTDIFDETLSSSSFDGYDATTTMNNHETWTTISASDEIQTSTDIYPSDTSETPNTFTNKITQIFTSNETPDRTTSTLFYDDSSTTNENDYEDETTTVDFSTNETSVTTVIPTRSIDIFTTERHFVSNATQIKFQTTSAFPSRPLTSKQSLLPGKDFKFHKVSKYTTNMPRALIERDTSTVKIGMKNISSSTSLLSRLNYTIATKLITTAFTNVRNETMAPRRSRYRQTSSMTTKYTPTQRTSASQYTTMVTFPKTEKVHQSTVTNGYINTTAATTHSNGNASTSSTTNFHVETSSENTDDSSWSSSFSDPTQESTETLLTTDLTTDEFYFTSSEDVLDENSERSSMVTTSIKSAKDDADPWFYEDDNF